MWKVGDRFYQYRDVIDGWVRWWNGPGRRGYRDPIIPPLTETSAAIACTLCVDPGPDFDRCRACGRAATDRALDKRAEADRAVLEAADSAYRLHWAREGWFCDCVVCYAVRRRRELRAERGEGS